MNKQVKVLLTLSLIIVIVAGLYIFTDWFSQVTGYFVGEEEMVKLAQCLEGKSAEFYGAANCADCQKQKEIFGKFFNRIPYVDCGENKLNCPNIKSIPALYVDKNIYYGVKTIPELKEISGCE